MCGLMSPQALRGAAVWDRDIRLAVPLRHGAVGRSGHRKAGSVVDNIPGFMAPLDGSPARRGFLRSCGWDERERVRSESAEYSPSS